MSETATEATSQWRVVFNPAAAYFLGGDRNIFQGQIDRQANPQATRVLRSYIHDAFDEQGSLWRQSAAQVEVQNVMAEGSAVDQPGLSCTVQFNHAGHSLMTQWAAQKKNSAADYICAVLADSFDSVSPVWGRRGCKITSVGPMQGVV